MSKIDMYGDPVEDRGGLDVRKEVQLMLLHVRSELLGGLSGRKNQARLCCRWLTA